MINLFVYSKPDDSLDPNLNGKASLGPYLPGA